MPGGNGIRHEIIYIFPCSQFKYGDLACWLNSTFDWTKMHAGEMWRGREDTRCPFVSIYTTYAERWNRGFGVDEKKWIISGVTCTFFHLQMKLTRGQVFDCFHLFHYSDFVCADTIADHASVRLPIFIRILRRLTLRFAFGFQINWKLFRRSSRRCRWWQWRQFGDRRQQYWFVFKHN